MIRFAEAKDAKNVMDLVMIVLKDMELDVFHKMSENELSRLLTEAYQDAPHYRYGYGNALVEEINGEIAGVAFGYAHDEEPAIDLPFKHVLHKNNYTDEMMLFSDSEVFPSEWYLDTLVTSPIYRGQGVASNLLNALPQLAEKKELEQLA